MPELAFIRLCTIYKAITLDYPICCEVGTVILSFPDVKTEIQPLDDFLTYPKT